MNIFHKQFKSETIGRFLLIFSILILLVTICLVSFLTLFGLETGVNIITMAPFFLLSIVALAFSVFGIYVGIRYIKRKGFKQNKQMGKLLIIFGLSYFIFTLIAFIFSNLTGNLGGWLQPVIAFLSTLISFPLGLTIKNGCK